MKTSELLKKYGIKLKKFLGQNLLSSQQVAKKIVKLSGVSNKDIVVEIGAGAGTLTEELAKVAKLVIAYEVDFSFKKLLEERLSRFENVRLVFEDFLEADMRGLEGFIYVANIPYSITGPIFEKILKNARFFFAVLMVQKEVAERILSRPGRRSYSYLSALVQSYCTVEKIMRVSRSHFIPNPKVDSVVLRMIWKGNELNFDEYSKFLSRVFSNKRKTIRNNLKLFIENPEELLKKLNIDPSTRAEQISPESLQRMFKLSQLSPFV